LKKKRGGPIASFSKGEKVEQAPGSKSSQTKQVITHIWGGKEKLPVTRASFMSLLVDFNRVLWTEGSKRDCGDDGHLRLMKSRSMGSEIED